MSSPDLYSIGVVLYEMLTGRVPFDAEAAVTIALKHVSESPPPPSAINPAIPPELEQVVLWTLNKDPADRPASADQLMAALEQCKAAILSGSAGQHTASMAAITANDGTGAFVPVPVAPAAPYEHQPTNGEGVLVEEVVRRRRRPPPWVWVLLAALLIVAAGLGAYLIAKPDKTVVPPVTGETLNVARTQLQNDGFTVGIINVADPSAAGTVIGEAPQANTKADNGSTVTLTVSQGPGNSTVPSVQGLRAAKAQRLIRSAHLKVGRTVLESSSQYPAGVVTRTDPTAGQSLPVDTGVTLFVSSGPAKVTVPDVRGEQQAAATQALTNANLKSTTSTQPSNTAAPGTVITQSPAGGSSVAQGTTVSLVIASAPAPVSVPNVQGQKAAAATTALTAAGFKVTPSSQAVTNSSQNGIVLSQSPTGGRKAKKGSTVRIVIGQFTAPTTSTTTTTPTTSSSTTTTTSSAAHP